MGKSKLKIREKKRKSDKNLSRKKREENHENLPAKNMRNNQKKGMNVEIKGMRLSKMREIVKLHHLSSHL